MGFDRGVLPRDRHRDESFPWMGLVAILVIVGGMLLMMIFAGTWSADPVPTETSSGGSQSRVVITAIL
ncbi:hypothetical protein BH23ACT4_BH23ACT4_01680 [soil metagenome]